MIKKIIMLVLIVSVFLSACGSEPTKSNTKEESKILEDIVSKSTENNFNESEESIVEENLNDKVEIIFSAFITDSEQSIESYVENLKTENPNATYKIYDESHYSCTITEQERLDAIAKLNSEDGILEINNEFSDFLVENEIDNYIANFELSKDYTEVKIYVQNIEELGWNAFSLYFGSQVYWSLILDSAQAYSLIFPEERNCKITFIDTDTKEEIKPFEN